MRSMFPYFQHLSTWSVFCFIYFEFLSRVVGSGCMHCDGFFNVIKVKLEKDRASQIFVVTYSMYQASKFTLALFNAYIIRVRANLSRHLSLKRTMKFNVWAHKT